MPAAVGHQALEDDHGPVGVDAAVALDRERLAGELVDDVQQLEDPPVGSLVELEGECSHLIGALGAQALRRYGRLSEASALAPAGRDPQALLGPDPLRALAAQLVALAPEPRVSAAVVLVSTITEIPHP